MTLLGGIKSRILPDHAMPCRILRGPFRGARVMLNPQSSLRYILGVYEHELNPWLQAVIPRSRVLLDVGASHGYFCCGFIAAWRRLGRGGTIRAFEPQAEAIVLLRASAELNAANDLDFAVEQAFVSHENGQGTVTLNSAFGQLTAKVRDLPCLVKVDVEGAEMDVLAGADELFRNGNNAFLIECHSDALLEQVSALFQERGHAFDVIRQHALPLLGRERRDVHNHWVVSKL